MPLFIRLFFVALLTQFLAVLLPVTERKAYDPLERTKHRVPVTGNDLAAHFAQRLWDGGYAAGMAVLRGL